MEELSLFDYMSNEDKEKYKKKKSTDWKWTFADYPKEKNGLKVFSCFACGGGSTMGYKLAGCEVVGCVEIDPKMNEIYVKNHHPKYSFCMDLREFNKIPEEDLPEELFHLDILDGSPPCTTFSMAGDREESWGKLKKFREGQAEQTLDDLAFVFIETAKKLKPKVIIMENVEGLLLGEAFSYVRRIYSDLKAAGYRTHHWLLKGERMGVPQTRHRVFFVSVREDLGIDPMMLDMGFDYEPVTYKQIKTGQLRKLKEDSVFYKVAIQAKPGDKCIADTRERLGEKGSAFQTFYLDQEKVIPTIRASPDMIDLDDMAYISKESLINAQTFPQDYDFGEKTYSSVGYICGMSVPPVMMKRVVQRLIDQGVFAYKDEAREWRQA